jgi:hypothetical protein
VGGGVGDAKNAGIEIGAQLTHNIASDQTNADKRILIASLLDELILF